MVLCDLICSSAWGGVSGMSTCFGAFYPYQLCQDPCDAILTAHTGNI